MRVFTTSGAVQTLLLGPSSEKPYGFQFLSKLSLDKESCHLNRGMFKTQSSI